MPDYDRTQLYEAIVKHLSADDLRLICFYLQNQDPSLANLDYDNLPQAKEQAALAIVKECDKRGTFAALVQVLQAHYPFVLAGVATHPTTAPATTSPSATYPAIPSSAAASAPDLLTLAQLALTRTSSLPSLKVIISGQLLGGEISGEGAWAGGNWRFRSRHRGWDVIGISVGGIPYLSADGGQSWTRDKGLLVQTLTILPTIIKAHQSGASADSVVTEVGLGMLKTGETAHRLQITGSGADNVVSQVAGATLSGKSILWLVGSGEDTLVRRLDFIAQREDLSIALTVEYEPSAETMQIAAPLPATELSS